MSTTKDTETIQDLEEEDDDIDSLSQYEMTLKSISELSKHRFFTENPGNLDRLFRPINSSTNLSAQEFDSNNNIINKDGCVEETDGASFPTQNNRPNFHPLVELPVQLDARTNIHFDKIGPNEPSGEDWYIRFRKWLYNFLNHPNGYASYLYHILMAFILLFYLGLIMFTSRTTWEENCFLYSGQHVLKSLFERILYLHFVIEFIIRFWSSRAQVSYRKMSNLRWIWQYFSRPSHILDFVLLIGGFMSASCLITKLPVDFIQDIYALITLRGLHRLFNVIQWTSIRSRESPWTVIYEVCYDGGLLLITMFNLVLLIIGLVAYGVYVAETHGDKDHPVWESKVTNLMDSIYMTTITLLSIGFGDLSPITYAGQALMGIGIWVALALFPLPSCLIATSIALKVTEQEEHRKQKTRKILATILIQRAWRLVRRRQQFELVHTLYLMRQTSRTENLEFPLKVDQSLWNKIDHVIQNRAKYNVSQFIQILLFQTARKKFRQFYLPIDPRPLVKSYSSKNQEIISILEYAHHLLEIDKLKLQTQWENQQQDLDLIATKLSKMQLIFQEQNQSLKQILGIPVNENQPITLL